jgi:DNA-binding transcriptional LysR family regulator
MAMNFKRRHLSYFVAIAEEGQITRAARKLELAQPALSQAIAQLESDLGFKLLERHARGVTLTAPGEVFLVKARAAVAAWSDAAATAQSLARVRGGRIEFGFLGVPPALDSPEILEMFCLAHPEIDLCYRELTFPSTLTDSWLRDVDVAVCHCPPADSRVWVHELRCEPRVVLVPGRHPLAESRELTIADVLDETFIGFHPLVDAAWAGFWSLDDHRGARPRRSTADGATNAQEVLAALAARQAITTVPAVVARLLPSVAAGVVAIPLSGADPARMMLVGHQDRANPLVENLRMFARGIGAR